MRDEEIQAEFAGLPDTLTVEVLARKLGKTEKTVYAWLAAGKIPGLRLEDGWLIYRNAVVRWLIEENHKQHPQT